MGFHKRRPSFPPFVALDRQMVLHGKEWKELPFSARVLYVRIKAKFNGHNNGQIRLRYSELNDDMSDGTISSGFEELEKNGWIERTAIGGQYRWECDIRITGKYDKAINEFTRQN